MTLFDGECIIYGKIDVFANISIFRLYTKLYKLFFLKFSLSANRMGYIPISSVDFFFKMAANMAANVVANHDTNITSIRYKIQ